MDKQLRWGVESEVLYSGGCLNVGFPNSFICNSLLNCCILRTRFLPPPLPFSLWTVSRVRGYDFNRLHRVNLHLVDLGSGVGSRQVSRGQSAAFHHVGRHLHTLRPLRLGYHERSVQRHL